MEFKVCVDAKIIQCGSTPSREIIRSCQGLGLLSFRHNISIIDDKKS